MCRFLRPEPAAELFAGSVVSGGGFCFTEPFGDSFTVAYCCSGGAVASFY